MLGSPLIYAQEGPKKLPEDDIRVEPRIKQFSARANGRERDTCRRHWSILEAIKSRVNRLTMIRGYPARSMVGTIQRCAQEQIQSRSKVDQVYQRYRRGLGEIQSRV